MKDVLDISGKALLHSERRKTTGVAMGILHRSFGMPSHVFLRRLAHARAQSCPLGIWSFVLDVHLVCLAPLAKAVELSDVHVFQWLNAVNKWAPPLPATPGA